MRIVLFASLLLFCVQIQADPGDELTFNYDVTSIEVTTIDGQRSLVVSCADQGVGRYGMVAGTLTLYGVTAGAKGGPAVWRAVAFGGEDIVTDTSPGSWKMTDSTVIRVRNFSNVSDGTSLSGDGSLDLKEMRFQGVAVEIE